MGDEHAIAFMSQVREQLRWFVSAWLILEHERAYRNGKLEILSCVTSAIRALAVLSAFCVELGMESVVDQGIGVRAGDDEDRAAVATVAAAGTAARHTQFTAERQASPPTCASRHMNVYFVNEHRIWSSHHQLIWSCLQIE
jgi:hypothetical protein